MRLFRQGCMVKWFSADVSFHLTVTRVEHKLLVAAEGDSIKLSFIFTLISFSSIKSTVQ